MFQSGSQINAGLGRTDYSAYTQGAAQGAAQIGQGMQQLGQGIGAAIKQYRMEQEKKEQEASAEQAVTSFAIQNPEEAKQIGLTDPTNEKLVKHLVKSFGGAAPTFQVINQFSQMKQQKEEFGMKRDQFKDQQKQNDIAWLASQYAQGTDMRGIEEQVPAELVSAAKQQAEVQRANLDLVRAKTMAELRPAKAEAMPEWKAYLMATPEQQAKMRELKQAASSKTEVTTVPGIATQGFKTFETKKDKVLALESTAQAYKDADKAIGEGAFTGTGAKAKLGLAKIGQSLGFNDWDNKIATTEFLRARLAQPTLDAAQVFPGSLSDGDRKFLMEASNGDIEASPATIKRMMDITQKTSDKAKKVYVSDVERVYGKGKETHDPYALSVLSFGEQQQEAPSVNQSTSSLKAKYGL
jgi:hypothetical protein